MLLCHKRSLPTPLTANAVVFQTPGRIRAVIYAIGVLEFRIYFLDPPGFLRNGKCGGEGAGPDDHASQK